PVHQRQVLPGYDRRPVADRAELPELGGDPRLGDPLHLLLVATPVRDQVRDGDEGQPVGGGELRQLVAAGHLADVPPGHHLAQHAGRPQAGQPGQVHGGLGVTGAAQHPTVAGTQRHHVARPGEVGGGRVRVGQQADGARPVGGGDAGGDAVPGVHRDRVRGAARVLVGVVHRRQVEPVAVGGGQRGADVPGRVPDGEVEQFGGGVLGGEDEVALVLPVLV